MFEWVFSAEIWASLLTLTALEIVLGIDNIVFISVVIERLPAREAQQARRIGLSLALIFRIILLAMLTWLIGFNAVIFELLGHEFSWRDLILISGGLFLLVKAIHEIHSDIEGLKRIDSNRKVSDTFAAVIVQIIVIDMVFSVDSIITAIGMARHVGVMIAAVVIAMLVMYVASGPISRFIKTHPTTKMLALSFLLLIGVALLAEGLGFHIPKGYIYFSMAFATLVEAINVFARKKFKADAN